MVKTYCFSDCFNIVELWMGLESVGADKNDDEEDEMDRNNGGVSEHLLGSDTELKEQPVGFIDAWKILGVAPFALCLLFTKVVTYTFLYWLPYYISHTGVLRRILAGHILNPLDARAITTVTFMYCAIPALFFYRSYGHISLAMNVALMFVCEIFMNGPYALIMTVVSADLRTHNSLRGNSKALVIVTSIIDREGLLLPRLVVAEVAARIFDSRSRGGSQSGPQDPELKV
ncbi:23.6 kDa heat shock protein [Hibiscus syriacus]|uniref:23.6 kDa heat shock protein n=1 Tax=Hibiscus syriacus TaxID=106335 RepID=A0A6A2XMV3_HIBSY|nr:23.6 kDa heat shock protein [Hibiscus syriacus]